MCGGFPSVVSGVQDIDKRYARRCATCECSFASNNQLHRHIRKHRHQRLGEAPRARTSNTISVQRFQEESTRHFMSNTIPNGCDAPSGSVMELPPGADEAGSRSLHIQDALGQTTDQLKPVDSVNRGHPGQRVPTHKITTRSVVARHCVRFGCTDIQAGVETQAHIGRWAMH